MTTQFGTWPQKEREKLATLRFPMSYISTPIQSTYPEVMARKVLEYLNIDINEIGQPSATIDGNQLRMAIESRTSTMSNDYSLGLSIAKHLNVATHGLYGLATISAETLGEALSLSDKYLCHVMPALEIKSEKKTNITESSLLVEPALGLAAMVIAEISAKVMLDIMSYAQETVVPLKIEFVHEAPCRLSIYEEFFSCPVEFDRQDNKVIYANESLDIPMKTRDKARPLYCYSNLRRIKNN